MDGIWIHAACIVLAFKNDRFNNISNARVPENRPYAPIAPSYAINCFD